LVLVSIAGAFLVNDTGYVVDDMYNEDNYDIMHDMKNGTVSFKLKNLGNFRLPKNMEGVGAVAKATGTSNSASAANSSDSDSSSGGARRRQRRSKRSKKAKRSTKSKKGQAKRSKKSRYTRRR
jgi:hypothetical protein